MTAKIRDDVTADMIAALERHRALHGITERDTTPANEHLFERIADGIRYGLDTFGGHRSGGGVADHDKWRHADITELVDAVMRHLRAGLTPKLDNIHAEVNAESAALIGFLKDELVEARRLLATNSPAAPRPESRPAIPALDDLPGQASLLEELETSR